MPLNNEQKNSKKYHHLFYVEFLDFVCRCGIEYFRTDDKMTIDQKVYEFVKKLYEDRWSKGLSS